MNTRNKMADAREQGTLLVKLTFYDEENNEVTPSTVLWTLTDVNGAIINSKEDVALTGITNPDYVVLTGNDLAISGNNDVIRKLLVEATYNSAHGTGLKLNQEIEFSIENLTAIP